MSELLRSPLSGLLLTLLAYQGAQALFQYTRHHPLAHPLLWAPLAILAFLRLAHLDYASYWEGGRLVHLLLGPATVALALPLYQQWPIVRRSWKALLGSILLGSVAGFGSALGLAALFRLPVEHWPSLAPKSVTTPIAIGIAEKLGGDPGLAVLAVVLTGVFGAMVGVSWLRLLRITDERAVGLALGIAAHGIGTARASQLGPTAAAFAGLGMGLCGLLTALLLPLLL